MFRFIVVLVALFVVATAWEYSKDAGFTATSCENIASDSKCLADSSCSWCTSAAVGDSCMDAKDADGLPAAVFTCSTSTSKAVITETTRNETLGGLFGKTVPAVTELDLQAYKGFWYQMYADKIVVATIEKDSFCDSALYGLKDDGTISVHNAATTDSPTGSAFDIDGYAYVEDPTKPGELKVHFNPTPGQNVAPFDAPYWVLELGPMNSDGQYDYSIVSDNRSSFLFVLARDVATFNEKYDAQVLKSIENMGFKSGLKKPIKIYQGDDCIYEQQK